MKPGTQKILSNKLLTSLTLAISSITLASCGTNSVTSLNLMPVYLGTISSMSYDGVTNDLLTAGLGKSGLASGTVPAYIDANNPSASELRRNAIYTNYRAVLDINANSGYGTLYGPNVDAKGNVTTGAGMVAGTEYIAYADDGSGTQNVTLMVQVPDSFDPNHACVITATSSGSRGIYGAVGSAGEWGLKNHCAVAYSDKGSGTGLYTFDDDSVNVQTGVRATRTQAGNNAIFTPTLPDSVRAAFTSAFPNRIAFKHAHSQQNSEKDWGKSTLQAVEFAYYILNQKYAVVSNIDKTRHIIRLDPSNTIVIASSISNGAGSALLAAEQDSKGLINGVAASEPQIQSDPPSSSPYTILQSGVAVGSQGKALFDYSTYAALYQPCIGGTTVAGNTGAARCTSLVSKGLLAGADLATQQANAKIKIHDYGWLPDSDILQASHAGTNILVAVTYANAYGRFSVSDNVCGFSFAATDASGNPVPMTAPFKAASFASQSGIIGSVVYENSVGGAKGYTVGISPTSSVADQSLDGFLCLRSLATGFDAVTGIALTGTLAAQSVRVRAGMAQVAATGNLHGKPAVIVQGRSDTLIPVNHASRAYLGLNAVQEGNASQLRYIEVTHANHFDSFSNVLPVSIVPLHVYLLRALDAVYAHLQSSQALPPSQVVRTVTRLDNTSLITLSNVPAIAATPVPADLISVTGTTVNVTN